VRISSASSSHVSLQPVIPALCLVLPHAVLATGDGRTVEPAALLGTHTGSGACHLPPWRELPWPLLASTAQDRGLVGPAVEGAALVGPVVLVRERRMRALAPAAAPVGSMAAPAPITQRQGQKAAVAVCPSNTPVIWNRDRAGAERDQPGPEPHLVADQSAVVECLLFFGRHGRHVSSSLTCRAPLRRPSTRSMTPQVWPAVSAVTAPERCPTPAPARPARRAVGERSHRSASHQPLG